MHGRLDGATLSPALPNREFAFAAAEPGYPCGAASRLTCVRRSKLFRWRSVDVVLNQISLANLQ